MFLLLTSGNPVNGQSVGLNGSTQYANLGNDASLHLTSFTLEAWIKIEGTSVVSSTGAGGFANIVPIITKGKADAEVAGTGCKLFFGI
ncbi:MAG: hypothetical protein IPP43_10680 [Chitinophagaceae bacterium]|nr:hypothetical protein [Chitinophagaceae bacterium]